MRSQPIRPLLLFVVASCVCGCSIAPVPPATLCRVESVLPDLSAFPEGWEEGNTSFRVRGCGVESIGRTYYPLMGFVNIDVCRFGLLRTAKEEFDSRKKNAPYYLRGWLVEDPPPFHSGVADASYVTCATVGGTRGCTFLVRYEEYLIDLNARVGERYLPLTALTPIMQQIDERMAECLSQRLPTPTRRPWPW